MKNLNFDNTLKSKVTKVTIAIILFVFGLLILIATVEAYEKDATLESLNMTFKNVSVSYQEGVNTLEAAKKAHEANKETMCQSWKALKAYKKMKGLEVDEEFNGCF